MHHPLGLLHIHCHAVIMQSILYIQKKFTKTHHSLPVIVRYGVSFVDSASDWYSVSVPAMMYAISSLIAKFMGQTWGLRSGRQLRVVRMEAEWIDINIEQDIVLLWEFRGNPLLMGWKCRQHSSALDTLIVSLIVNLGMVKPPTSPFLFWSGCWKLFLGKTWTSTFYTPSLNYIFKALPTKQYSFHLSIWAKIRIYQSSVTLLVA